ncbi:MAG: phage major capsid protein [Candidatus Methanoperedens sp.]
MDSDLVKEMETVWGEVKTGLDGLRESQKKQGDEIAQIKTAMNRRDPVTQTEIKATQTPQFKAWVQWVRDGIERPEIKTLQNEEGKALQVDRDDYGGYWVPPVLADQIIEFQYRVDPLRNIANVVTLPNSDVYEFVRETGAPEVGWVAERGTRAETDTTHIAKERIVTHSMYCYPKTTAKMLRISSFNVESWLVKATGRRMGYYEGTAFIAGDGAGKPSGLNCSAIGATVASGDANTIADFDCLIEMQDTLLEQYQGNASWLMNRATKSVLRQMTDGIGRYILEPSVVAGQPDQLFGKPVYYMPSMDDIAGSAFPIIYGDIDEAYTIIDNPEIQMIRDEVTSPGFVKLLFQRDVGGSLVDPQAAIRLEITA